MKRITGIKATLDRLKKSQRRAALIIKTLNKRLEVIIRRLIKQNFKNQSSAEGEAWKPLSPIYAAWKKEKGYTSKILIGTTGKLRKTAITSGMQKIYKNGMDVLMDVTLPYARIHEFGGIAGRGATIPARPYFGVTQADVDDKIGRLVESFLLKDLK